MDKTLSRWYSASCIAFFITQVTSASILFLTLPWLSPIYDFFWPKTNDGFCVSICHCFQVKRTLGQFTPAQWDKDEWHPLLGPWRFVQVLFLCIVFLTVELNTFFLKFCLWIPAQNPLIVYRLILWWLIAIPTIREYNSFLQDRYSLSTPTFSHMHVEFHVFLFLLPLFLELQQKSWEHFVGSPLLHA